MLATANERGNFPDDPNKDDPLDFVLWQAAKPGEPTWESPWGPGRPGWHIECSAMALKYLGQQIDIHGGGSDLIFPHHSCEITQSEHYTGVVPFARFWMHTAMVEQDGEKMSKSLGNMTFVRDIVRDLPSRRAAPVPARTPLPRDVGVPARGAGRERRRWRRGCARPPPRRGGHGAALDVTPQRERFFNAMDDDLQTPHAIAACRDLADAIHAAARGGDVAAAQETLREMAGVLGLWLDTTPPLP